MLHSAQRGIHTPDWWTTGVSVVHRTLIISSVMSDSMLNRHGYKLPFCERQQRGYETVGAFAVEKVCYNTTAETAHYRTRGGEWRGCIAATSHFYMVSVVRRGNNEWRKETARKLISLKSTRFSRMTSPCRSCKFFSGGTPCSKFN